MLKERRHGEVINAEVADELDLCEQEGGIYSAEEMVSPESSEILADYRVARYNTVTLHWVVRDKISR